MAATDVRAKRYQHGPAAVAMRAAVASDASTLFEWVNRPDSLAAKLRTPEPVTWERHRAWLRARLHDGDTRIWIAEIDGRPIGQVRVQRGQVGTEVDIFVEAGARNLGIGRDLLAWLARRCGAEWPGTALIARVKPANRASRRLFAAAGYEMAEAREDHLVYRLVPEGESRRHA